VTTDEIRAKYIEFFEQRDHVAERSDSLVPSDATLLFSSAGMVQFKPYWAGTVPLPYGRAVTCQKCFRVNDIDEVGHTSRHNTFFEMLGNFSFGDYFKKEACEWAWEFVVDVLKLDKSALWISVFRDDDEAYDVWHTHLGVPDDRIVRLDEKDNFWGPAGDTGACGPCSEIYLDRGAEQGCGKPDCLPGCDCDRYIEFWNLVFPQFEQMSDGSRKPLKNRGIDTGMGLERTAAVMQGVQTVFETDLLWPMVEATVDLAGADYGSNPRAFNVIADHLRAVSFLMADGVLPSNEGRGYVVRRVIRRGARYGTEVGLKEPFMHKLSGIVADLMGNTYPELVQSRERVSKILLSEEERFRSTLDHGMARLEEVFEGLEKKGDSVVPGDDVFRLYDTYGFPLELAGEVAADRGFELDRAGFETHMEEQRRRARSSWTGSGEGEVAAQYVEAHEKFGDTDFVGYENTSCDTRAAGIIADKTALLKGDEGEVVLQETPFYAEAGGQVADTGWLIGDGLLAEVVDVRKPTHNLYVHRVVVKEGQVAAGDAVEARADADRRLEVACHHTATHILQSVLRDILGEHVHQAGSLVAPDRLRFDFTHFEAISPDQLQEIEHALNERVRRNSDVEVSMMPLDDARRLGAMALFGEKYDDVVRVVSVGDYSKELCGGTHLDTAGPVGYCKIISESSVAAGVRRIEAVCGRAFQHYLDEQEKLLADASSLLGGGVPDLPSRVQRLADENKRLNREIERLKTSLARGGTSDLISQVQDVDGTKVLAAQVDNCRTDELRAMADSLKDKLGSGVVLLGSAVEGAVVLVCAVTKDLTPKLHAGKIVKQVAAAVGGGGGGRPDFAQAGGKKTDKLPEAVNNVPEIVRSFLAS